MGIVNGYFIIFILSDVFVGEIVFASILRSILILLIPVAEVVLVVVSLHVEQALGTSRNTALLKECTDALADWDFAGHERCSVFSFHMQLFDRPVIKELEFLLAFGLHQAPGLGSWDVDSA